jgi:hypothetical protein
VAKLIGKKDFAEHAKNDPTFCIIAHLEVAMALNERLESILPPDIGEVLRLQLVRIELITSQAEMERSICTSELCGDGASALPSCRFIS